MSWSDVSNIVAKAAPLVGTLLGGPAGGTIGGMVASVLDTDPEPRAVLDALKADPAAIERVRKLELDHEKELKRMSFEAETARLAEVNRTMRAEAASNDGYVRRWRPTFGYAVAATWTIQTIGLMVAIGYAISKPEQASVIINAIGTLMGAMTVMWSLALAVLGVNVAKRSQDKQVAAGQEPATGFLQAIAKRISGSKNG